MNQDGLENLFAVIRQKNGCNFNPSCIQFESSLRHIFVGNLFKLSDKSSNCEKDIDEIIKCIKKNKSEFICSRLQLNKTIDNTEDCHFENLPSDFKIIADNINYYVAGWIAKKIASFHKCEKCKLQHNNPTLEDQIQLLTMFKVKNATSSDFGKLTLPSKEFFYFIQNCETIFLNNVNSVLHEKNVRQKLLSVLLSVVDKNDLTVCSEKIFTDILNYFIKIRIF